MIVEWGLVGYQQKETFSSPRWSYPLALWIHFPFLLLFGYSLILMKSLISSGNKMSSLGSSRTLV